jgi:DNA-binding IclR family transcriptional regulator
MEVLRELASEECLRRGGLGVVRIAERLGREKSQVSRALRALAAEGLVERDPLTRTYQLGWGLYTLAARGVETRLVRAASGTLHRLAEQHRARTRLCVLIGGQVLSLLAVAPGSTERSDSMTEGEAVAITATAAGPALVLDWPDIALRDLLMPDEHAYHAVLGHIEHARRHRYVAFGEQPGAAAVPGYAAAVRDFRGIVLAAIELSWPAEEDAAIGHDASAVSASLVHSAAALSGDLGYDQRPARA